MANAAQLSVAVDESWMRTLLCKSVTDEYQMQNMYVFFCYECGCWKQHLTQIGFLSSCVTNRWRLHISITFMVSSHLSWQWVQAFCSFQPRNSWNFVHSVSVPQHIQAYVCVCLPATVSVCFSGIHSFWVKSSCVETEGCMWVKATDVCIYLNQCTHDGGGINGSPVFITSLSSPFVGYVWFRCFFILS